MQNLKFRYQSQIKIKHFALKHISQIIFYFPKFKILSFYFFKKSTIWGTFSKTFYDWYLRFKGAPDMYSPAKVRAVWAKKLALFFLLQIRRQTFFFSMGYIGRSPIKVGIRFKRKVSAFRIFCPIQNSLRSDEVMST